ncbi:hypothetical protein LPW11_09905 [Geomonas sp. RF6]|uniref:hypothetical protein n=1 Tax=Geomonas sp. RF6 TaxID=2897342 RepID=UPI001E3D2E6E|nr:hypothetical protein [Geomonas sp. RF6]UFS72488.1 hypothetical protein LPW11_09905 [Geomonas sp. RF6]
MALQVGSAIAMHNLLLPDLTFPDVSLGRNETPWNLLSLLFKGGAATNVGKVAERIRAGSLGSPLLERISLVQKIHEEISSALASGGSKETAKTQIERARAFFSWVDRSASLLSVETVESNFLQWTDYLLHRVRVVKDIQHRSAYKGAMVVGDLLDKVLERRVPIISNTRLFPERRKHKIRGIQADKQNLTETFMFGHALLDIVDSLNVNAIWGPLPLRIRLRTGQELEEWSGLMQPRPHWAHPTNSKERFHQMRRLSNRARYENEATFGTRYRLINLRIEAELLLFIGVTGMNLAQAHRLKVRHYSYRSTMAGYEVRDYKNRRQGEVLFNIYSEYKAVFERYLEWRKVIFEGHSEELLFPLLRTRGRAEDMRPHFNRVRDTCKKLRLPFIPPSRLRNTQVNWMLRRSNDADLTSELAQHTKETLLDVYEEPSLQRAVVEVARFWQSRDPALPSPAPGVCNGVPAPIVDIPPEAPQPDCIRPTGCLWCEYHRDIDSLDYVWSLASMRHLKILSLKGFLPSDRGKDTKGARMIEMAIERLTAKLRWFRQSNELRRKWVIEVLLRIDEAHYHPHWYYLIAALEGE